MTSITGAWIDRPAEGWLCGRLYVGRMGRILPVSGRDTHNPGQSALCATMDRRPGRQCCPANHSILNGPTQGWCSIRPQWVFSGSQGRGWIGTWLSGLDGGYTGQLEREEEKRRSKKTQTLCKRQIFRDNPTFCASWTLRFRVWCQTERFIGREWKEKL